MEKKFFKTSFDMASHMNMAQYHIYGLGMPENPTDDVASNVNFVKQNTEPLKEDIERLKIESQAHTNAIVYLETKTLSLKGGAVIGNIDMTNHNITNLASPKKPYDAVSLEYLDNRLSNTIGNLEKKICDSKEKTNTEKFDHIYGCALSNKLVNHLPVELIKNHITGWTWKMSHHDYEGFFCWNNLQIQTNNPSLFSCNLTTKKPYKEITATKPGLYTFSLSLQALVPSLVLERIAPSIQLKITKKQNHWGSKNFDQTTIKRFFFSSKKELQIESKDYTLIEISSLNTSLTLTLLPEETPISFFLQNLHNNNFESCDLYITNSSFSILRQPW